MATEADDKLCQAWEQAVLAARLLLAGAQELTTANNEQASFYKRQLEGHVGLICKNNPAAAESVTYAINRIARLPALPSEIFEYRNIYRILIANYRAGMRQDALKQAITLEEHLGVKRNVWLQRARVIAPLAVPSEAVV